MSKYSDHVTDFNRDGTRLAVLGDSLISMGGWIPGNSFSDVYSTKDLKTWVKINPACAWVGRHTFGAGKISDKLFIWCGDPFHLTMDCWSSYDGANWHLEGVVPGAVCFLYGSFSDGVYLYKIGGMSNIYSTNGVPNDVCTSVDGIHWEQLNGIPYFGRCLSGACCMFNKVIYVVSGGIYGSGVGTQEMYSSSDQGYSWYREPDVPFVGRYYHDTIVWDNKLWVICGYGKGANLRDIWMMDANGTWTQFMGVPDDFIGRHASGVAVFQDKLVIANGNFQNSCWAIEKV